MNELHLYSENYQIDVDSMLSLDEDICLVNNTSAVYSNTGSAMQPFPTGIIQISPNGTNDEMDRYFLAPTPPLIMTEYDMTLASFLSPTTTMEPTTMTSSNAGLSSTIISTPFQCDHRHVTPLPLGTSSSVPSRNLPSNSIEMSNSASKDVNTDTADAMISSQETGVATINTSPSIAYGVSMEPSLPVAGNRLYVESMNFPMVVHRMITETCKVYDPSLMHWSDCGNYFWIEQKHKLLSSVIAQYFNHNRYQSLRRQLNMYGFGKYVSGHKKGYWKHLKFCRDCTYNDLKSIASKTVIFGKRKKKVANRLASSKACNVKAISKSDKNRKLEIANVQAKSFSSNESELTKSLVPDNVVSKQTVSLDEAQMYQVEDSYENKFYSGGRRSCILNEETTGGNTMKGVMMKSEIDSLHIDDPFLSEPLPDLGYEIPPFFDESSSDALTALATIASFLPIAPMPLYTPIAKSLDIIKPVPMNQTKLSTNVVSSQELKMTILTDAAFWFFPTPIKVPTGTSCDQFPPWTDSGDSSFDDAVSLYSIGSLSSPMKLILPFSERSAFTPVVSSTDHMVVEFCESFH